MGRRLIYTRQQTTATPSIYPLYLTVLVVGGGGGGAGGAGNGGNGGCTNNIDSLSNNYTISSASSINVVVGTGGNGSTTAGSTGNPSSFGTIYCSGGTGGLRAGQPQTPMYTAGWVAAGTCKGGDSWNGSTQAAYNGGTGWSSSITGSAVKYSGGGGAGCQSTDPLNAGSAGADTGGAGGKGANNGAAGNGKGGGGGGGGFSNPTSYTGGKGGTGIVIVRYTAASQIGSGGSVTTDGGDYIHTFTGNGTFTI